MDNFYAIPYDPTQFEIDLRYFKGRQTADLKNFISVRYQRNKAHVQAINTNLTKTFIRNSSNIYKNEVSYPNWKDDKMIEKRRNSLAVLENYFNLQQQALLWMFKIDKKWNFKAIHASDYIASFDIMGTLEKVIIRTGTRLQQLTDKSSETWYSFKLWYEGKIYNCVAKDWQSLPSIISNEETVDFNTPWIQDSIQPTFDIFPFTVIGIDIATPISSNLITMENIVSGAFGWGEIAGQRNFLKQLVGKTRLTQGEWTKLNKQIGLMSSIDLKLSESANDQPTLDVLDLGDAKAQLDYYSFISEALKQIAYSNGVDINGLFSDTKVESGKARLLAMQNIISVRNDNIRIWSEFEERNQELMVKLGIVPNESEVIYHPLPIGETELEREELEEKRQLNITNRFKNGTITRLQMIKELEDLTDAEALARMNEIDKQRGNDINMPINNLNDEGVE